MHSKWNERERDSFCQIRSHTNFSTKAKDNHTFSYSVMLKISSKAVRQKTSSVPRQVVLLVLRGIIRQWQWGEISKLPVIEGTAKELEKIAQRCHAVSDLNFRQ